MTAARSSWRVVAAFAVVYLAASLAGRLLLVPGTTFALVWPAAGVGVIWLTWVRGRRAVVTSAALLLVEVGAVNLIGGRPPLVASGFAAANLVQTVVFVVLLRRWRAEPGAERFSLGRSTDLAPLVAATLLAAAAGTLIGPTTAWLGGIPTTPMSTLNWWARNSVSILGIYVVADPVMRWWTDRSGRAGARSPWLALTSAPGRGRAVAHLVGVLVSSALGLWLIFWVDQDLPVAFLYYTTTVWVALCFRPVVTAWHALASGAVVMALTLTGHGLFGGLPSGAEQALVVQLYVTLALVLGLAISLGRADLMALTGSLRRSEQDAQGRARLKRAILDSMSEGLLVIAKDGLIRHRNVASNTLVPADATHFFGAADLDVHHPDGSAVADDELPLRQAFDGEAVRGVDLHLADPRGGEVILHATVTPMSSVPDEETDLAIMAFHDVTAQRLHEEQLASFAGVVAHDLLNPLAAIHSWTDELEYRCEGAGTLAASEVTEVIPHLHNGVRRMRDLVNDLLAYTVARDRSFTPTDIDLHALALDVAQQRTDADGATSAAAGRPRATVRVRSLPDVLGEPTLLRQLLDNLVGNALKYVEPGTAPLVTISSEVDGTSQPTGDSGDSHASDAAASEVTAFVTIHVRDNGIGVPEGDHERIFETFHRAHARDYRGTGLGLAICRTIVERHGGRIAAASNADGPGTTFTFSLPVSPVAPVDGSRDERDGVRTSPSVPVSP